MKAQVIRSWGGPEVLEAAELPDPAPQAGEVLVRIAAASVNPVDGKIRSKGPPFAPELPAVLGCDFAGQVEAVGPGVTGFAVGQAVHGCAGGVRGVSGGAYAELIAADARLVAPAPASLSPREAAALPLVTITAWEGLFDRARLTAGQSLLVRGGTGGVGHIVLQLARQAGARVVATVSSARKAALARKLGASETVNYKEEPVPEAVARLTEGAGFDLVFDATGGSDFATNLEVVRPGGQIVTIVSRYTADLSPMHGKGLSLHVIFMLLPMILDRGRERHGEILREAAERVDAGQLRPLLDDSSFRLEEAAAAHRRLEAGEATGKIVLEVAALD